MQLRALHARRPTTIVFGLSFLLITLLLRYLWSLSLGNRDEIFFSTGAGRFEIGAGSLSQWGEFFSWIWWEHTGRTADWLSGTIYLFGAEAGKWLVSILTATSIGAIVWCFQRLLSIFYAAPKRPLLTIPIAMLALLFSYSYSDLKLQSNLTTYSAAVCNYIVPTALVIIAITLVLTGSRTYHLYSAAIIGFAAATMHEQAATVVATLAVLLFVLGPTRWSRLHRFISSALMFLGVLEMFMAPGLRTKLDRASSAIDHASDPVIFKIIRTFSTYGEYFPVIIVLVSGVLVFQLLRTAFDTGRKISVSLLALVILGSSVLWGVSFKFPDLDFGVDPYILSGTSCGITMIAWLVAPLFARTQATRFGSVILLCAAASMAIPAVAGLSQNLRVFNYPSLFLIAFLIWSMFTGSQFFGKNNTGVQISGIATAILATILLLVSINVTLRVVTAFHENYAIGLEDLQRQQAACTHVHCLATNPDVPHPRALSGYSGNEDINYVLEWIGH